MKQQVSKQPCTTLVSPFKSAEVENITDSWSIFPTKKAGDYDTERQKEKGHDW